MSRSKDEAYPNADSRAARMLSEGLQRLASEHGKSLRRVAQELGFKQATVLSHMATGRMPIPIDRAIELAEAVLLPVREFALAVLEQRHPTVHWRLVAAADPVLADLETYAGQPIDMLPPDQLRVIREAAADPNAPRRWMTLLETPVMELVRELRPEVAVHGLSGADRDRLMLALSEGSAVPDYRKRGPSPPPRSSKVSTP